MLLCQLGFVVYDTGAIIVKSVSFNSSNTFKSSVTIYRLALPSPSISRAIPLIEPPLPGKETRLWECGKPYGFSIISSAGAQGGKGEVTFSLSMPQTLKRPHRENLPVKLKRCNLFKKLLQMSIFLHIQGLRFCQRLLLW